MKPAAAWKVENQWYIRCCQYNQVSSNHICYLRISCTLRWFVLDLCPIYRLLSFLLYCHPTHHIHSWVHIHSPDGAINQVVNVALVWLFAANKGGLCWILPALSSGFPHAPSLSLLYPPVVIHPHFLSSFQPVNSRHRINFIRHWNSTTYTTCGTFLPSFYSIFTLHGGLNTDCVTGNPSSFYSPQLCRWRPDLAWHGLTPRLVEHSSKAFPEGESCSACSFSVLDCMLFIVPI